VRVPTFPTIDEDAPITLADAAKRFGFKVATLRAEASRGNLTIYKIGKRYYTTLNDVRAMVQNCRVQNPRQGFTSTRDASNGLSETARASSARAALNMSIERLKSSSRATSL
jgi:hypothetical protein